MLQFLVLATWIALCMPNFPLYEYCKVDYLKATLTLLSTLYNQCPLDMLLIPTTFVTASSVTYISHHSYNGDKT